MSRKSVRMILSVVLLGWLARAGYAQEISIYTQVYNEAAAAKRANTRDKPPIIARSLSLFHAGKVYDYIDTIDEVIVFEPARRRFTILSTSRMMATTVDFDELKHLLKVARRETEKYLTQLEAEGSPASQKAIPALRFQLEPQFETTFDQEHNWLSLKGRYIRYRVQCARVQYLENVDAYLRYADWMARLNYVLHPQSLFPEPRLLLNASLRRHKVMPVEVELRADIESGIHLRAQHQIHWKLNEQERKLIHRWETLLRNKRTRQVPFREYQRVTLVAESHQRGQKR